MISEGKLLTFDLFLLDMDGLLVDSEAIHFEAFFKTAKDKKLSISWSLEEYLEIAHAKALGLKEEMEKKFPKYFKESKAWEDFKQEKEILYQNFLKERKIHLMPGVEELLEFLRQHQKISCVVTNSSKEVTQIIRSKMDKLSIINHWLTREDYKMAKPAPDGYLKAIGLYALKESRIIGFEDSIKGILALLKTSALPVLVSKKAHEIKDLPDRVVRVDSLQRFDFDNKPFLEKEPLLERELK